MLCSVTARSENLIERRERHWELEPEPFESVQHPESCCAACTSLDDLESLYAQNCSECISFARDETSVMYTVQYKRLRLQPNNKWVLSKCHVFYCLFVHLSPYVSIRLHCTHRNPVQLHVSMSRKSEIYSHPTPLLSS